MNFFHCPIKICKRSLGRSVVAASAYINRTRLENTWDGTVRDYTRKGGLVYSEVMLPANAPPQYADRFVLWNSVEWNETKRNAQLARVIELALPAELTHEQSIALARKFIKQTFVDQGMCADFALHDKGDGNPHVHILLTMRAINEDGTWAEKGRLVYNMDENGNRIPANQKGRWKNHKERTVDCDNRGNAEFWRAAAAGAINEALKEAGFTQGFVDHRSYARQSIQKIPMIHEGPEVRALENRGIRTEIGDINRGIREKNKQIDQLQARLTRLNAYAQHEKKVDEALIAKGMDVSNQNLRYRLASQIYDAPLGKGGTKRRIQEVSGLMTIMKQRNITDAASLAGAVTEENERFYEFRSRWKQNQELSDEISVRIEAYNDYKAYAKVFKKWCKLSGPEKSAFERQHEFELHKYHEADAALRRWKDDGERIDINAWNEALKYLNREQFFLDREIDMRKETIRKLEVVKREFSKNRKEKNRNAPAGYPQQERSGRCTDYFLL